MNRRKRRSRAAAAPAAVAIAPPVAPAPQPVPATPTPLELAASAAQKYSLPVAFVASVMRAESGFNPAAVSPKGAIGLMQLMPETARELGRRPRESSSRTPKAARRYLRDLLAQIRRQPDQVLLALAAYNAGPAAVERIMAFRPIRETREYILRVLKNWNPPSAAVK